MLSTRGSAATLAAQPAYTITLSRWISRSVYYQQMDPEALSFVTLPDSRNINRSSYCNGYRFRVNKQKELNYGKSKYSISRNNRRW